MRSTRGPSGAEPSRADAAARRLALLAADLGAADPEPQVADSWLPDHDVTRVVPSRRAAPAGPTAPLPGPTAAAVPPPAVPRPGRHAARRRSSFAVRLPGLGAPQLTVLALVVAVGIAVSAWWVVGDQSRPAPPSARPAATAEPLVATDPSAGVSATSGGEVTVDVTGKVRRPGIVVLDAGARVVDALAAAGGERTGVDLSSLNLARVLVDGEQIVVGAPQGPVPTVPAAPPGTAPPGAPVALVNLNTASQAELETLPDVGPVTALAILSWREEHGGFTSVDELLEVDGIGEATLSNLAPYVTV